MADDPLGGDVDASGEYTVRKRFRNEEHRRHKKDLPWSKQILDMEENRFFGRTPLGWSRILLFYIVLYGLIILIVIVWLLVFFLFRMPEGRPLYLKSSPGLSTVPGNTSTISFFPNIVQEIQPLVSIIESFLNKLDSKATEVFSECNADKKWGYSSESPCIFIKINKVIGFKAETYESADELPKGAPDIVSKNIVAYKGPERIWLSCDATDGGKPKMQFIPGPYYDADNLNEGCNRAVALKLTSLPANEEVRIVCKIWAKNIIINEQYAGQGNTKFVIKLKIESSDKPKPDDTSG